MAHVDLTHSSVSSDTDNDSDVDVESLRTELVRLRQKYQSIVNEKNEELQELYQRVSTLEEKNEEIQELRQRISTLEEENEDAVASARSRAKQAYRAEQREIKAKNENLAWRLSETGDNICEIKMLKHQVLVLTLQRDEAEKKLKATEPDSKSRIDEAIANHAATNTLDHEFSAAKNIICSSIEALRTTGIRPEFLLQQMEKATGEMVKINDQQKLKYETSNARAEAAKHNCVNLEKENNSLKDINDTLLQRIRDMQV